MQEENWVCQKLQEKKKKKKDVERSCLLLFVQVFILRVCL